jgi:hypothetical protein
MFFLGENPLESAIFCIILIKNVGYYRKNGGKVILFFPKIAVFYTFVIPGVFGGNWGASLRKMAKRKGVRRFFYGDFLEECELRFVLMGNWKKK